MLMFWNAFEDLIREELNSKINLKVRTQLTVVFYVQLTTKNTELFLSIIFSARYCISFYVP